MKYLVFFAVVAVCTAAFAQQAAQSIEAPPGARLLLEARGEGAQVYTCTNSKWMLKAPDAKLLDAKGEVIGTHFSGPTWRLNDGSEVKGKLIASQPAPDGKSIAWLLVGAVPGSESGKFAAVAYIRRTETQRRRRSERVVHGGELPVRLYGKVQLLCVEIMVLSLTAKSGFCGNRHTWILRIVVAVLLAGNCRWADAQQISESEEFARIAGCARGTKLAEGNRRTAGWSPEEVSTCKTSWPGTGRRRGRGRAI